MIKGFTIQKVLLICILEIPKFIDLKNDKTDSKSDELEIPVTWTLKRLFLYTVRQILSPKCKTLLVLCCLNSFKWGVSSFLTTKLHFTFLSLSFRLILNLYGFLSLYKKSFVVCWVLAKLGPGQISLDGWVGRVGDQKSTAYPEHRFLVSSPLDRVCVLPACLTSSIASFGCSGRVTHALMCQIVRNPIKS